MTTADHAADRPEGWAAPGKALVDSALTDPVPTLAEMGRVHIVGIAGAGMSGLARILLARGITVSGSETRESDTVTALRALGARIAIGHAVSNVEGVDSVVYSTAIPPNHLELLAARDRGLPVLRRAAALAAALGDRSAIAVAGTHGKTTTTSLLTVALQSAGLDPSFAIGGTLYATGRNAHYGTGQWAVIEADESDGSFLLLHPQLAVVTNVEADHLENHGDLEGVFRAFEHFAERLEPDGLLVACADDAGAMRIAGFAREGGRRVITYGQDPAADVTVTDIDEAADAVSFTVGVPERTLRVQVHSLVGRHMALNATAALIVALELGCEPSTVLRTWSQFGGVQRRFELRGQAGGVRVYDDYAHHPTEIAAQLRAARAAIGGDDDGHPGRVIAVFQPGTYSRTQTFAQEFGDALALADVAVVMDVYPAREEPIPGVSGRTITERIALPPDRIVYEPSWAATPQRIAEIARAGDIVVTMGIGDVYLLCPEILAALAAPS